ATRPWSTSPTSPPRWTTSRSTRTSHIGSRPSERRSRARSLDVMVVVRDIEPWDALLEAGRADDRLVRQAMVHAREPQMVALPQELHPDVVAGVRGRGIDFLWQHQ